MKTVALKIRPGDLLTFRNGLSMYASLVEEIDAIDSFFTDSVHVDFLREPAIVVAVRGQKTIYALMPSAMGWLGTSSRENARKEL
jgi:hypothetical protein